MKRIDHADFFIYTRMTPQVYEIWLTLVEPFLNKNSLRESVQPECRLALTLQYLSQGTSFQSLAWSFQLGKETVRRIILETAEVLWTKLGAVYVSEPNEEDFKQISQDFWELWNMPNCVGSIDGNHIAIRCPPKSGSQFFCYKKIVSIVLLAVCDARYRYIDIGAYGSQSDGGIFQVSRLGKRLLDHKLPIPPAKNLPNTQLKTPHFFVGDAAFPLGINLMCPYPGGMLPNEKEVFKSRDRRTIENSFGILVARWRVLLTTLHLFPENEEKIVLACVALHNFIMFNNVNASSYIASNYADWEDSNGDFHDGLGVLKNKKIRLNSFQFHVCLFSRRKRYNSDIIFSWKLSLTETGRSCIRHKTVVIKASSVSHLSAGAAICFFVSSEVGMKFHLNYHS
ncbi:protein ALP1-like [Bactrocera tryoni]|uniref:protein ALP1-like n=1 Tax=Bactrocera tryoni TaxID=59916 RepID=UPI001A95B0CE|nr:protein ALP1-like [Bactrocera tryoni]